ncbi:hypothetical protein SAMN05216338_100266 [Bradyrhizobium sp. Rc2d]|nr:hypothetical protein SAMN05216338_100266 [Bradyrhizobium sp. Rc2d]
MRVFLQAREVYGVSFNRLVLEFARVPAFAKFIKDNPSDLGNSISNPIGKGPLPRSAYDSNVERQLGQLSLTHWTWKRIGGSEMAPTPRRRKYENEFMGRT